jgi:hypothetical protein
VVELQILIVQWKQELNIPKSGIVPSPPGTVVMPSEDGLCGCAGVTRRSAVSGIGEAEALAFGV